jgi:hypothetical protein
VCFYDHLLTPPLADRYQVVHIVIIDDVVRHHLERIHANQKDAGSDDDDSNDDALTATMTEIFSSGTNGRSNTVATRQWQHLQTMNTSPLNALSAVNQMESSGRDTLASLNTSESVNSLAAERAPALPLPLPPLPPLPDDTEDMFVDQYHDATRLHMRRSLSCFVKDM